MLDQLVVIAPWFVLGLLLYPHHLLTQ